MVEQPNDRLQGLGSAAATTVLAIGVLPGPVVALSPSDGGPVTLLPVTINVSTGDQYDPHVSGDLAAYTSDNSIRYYNFFSGLDLQVPGALGATDQLSDVSDGKIVFSRLDAALRSSIIVYDTAVPSMTEIDPSAATPMRSNGAIGSNTVAYIDRGLEPTGELVAADLGTLVPIRITTDTRRDRQPQVAPLGDLIVYESCLSSPANCDMRQAEWNAWIRTLARGRVGPTLARQGWAVTLHTLRAGGIDAPLRPLQPARDEVPLAALVGSRGRHHSSAPLGSTAWVELLGYGGAEDTSALG